MSKQIENILNAMKESGKLAVVRELDNVLPPQFRKNPGKAVEEKDNSDSKDDGGDVDLDADGMAFENDNADDNLASAAAAYRMLGAKGDIIASHEPTGHTFFGTEDGLEEYCETVDLSIDDWDIYDRADDILALEYDQDTMKEILRDLRNKDIATAQDQYAGFHWGDEAKVIAIKDIPGLKSVDAPLTLLGVGREICYGAKKEGKFEEYYHEFGEESGTFPRVYALGTKVLIVCGGNMRVEDRGIVD